MVDLIEAGCSAREGDHHSAIERIVDLAAGFAVLGPHFDAYRLSVIGSLYLAGGQFAAALECLTQGLGQARAGALAAPGIISLEVDWAEAAIGVGRLVGVEAHLCSIEERSTNLGRDNVLADCARARVLLLAARGSVAEAAAAVPGMLTMFDDVHRQPVARGRAHLTAGLVLRRARSKTAAAGALSHALTIFEELGHVPYTAQTRSELARVGLRPRAPGELTCTEQQIAELAAQGLRNKEIAERTFTAAKTVEAVLGRCYRKLEVRSRAELAHALHEHRKGDGTTDRGILPMPKQHPAPTLEA